MKVLTSTINVTTAVIFCGLHHEDLSPIVRGNPVWMLPVLNTPLIEHTLKTLEINGFKKVVMSIPALDNFDVEQYMSRLKGEHRGIELFFASESVPHGTAGALRNVRRFVEGEGFIALGGDIFIGSIDFSGMISSHGSAGAVVTVGVTKSKSHHFESVNLGRGGEIKEFSAIHPSRDRRSRYRPVGIYVFEPMALDYIAEKGYFDIKEQLIPALKAESLPVNSFEISGYCRSIHSVEDYFEIHREALYNGFGKTGLVEIAEGVWSARDAKISPKAFIVGPTIIGNNAVIGDHVQIIGPAVVGDNCSIRDRAKVRESIVHGGCELEKDTVLRHCVAGEGVRVDAGEGFSNKILVDGLKVADANLMPSRYQFNGVVEAAGYKFGGMKHSAFLMAKRLLDIAISAVCIAVFAPLMLLIAILVKTDSAGPVIFRQKRCGKGGADFEMLKFRTMVKDAHALQQKLAREKSIDGPMFKLAGDPRITRIGRMLRKTSLDELPQLFNVFKGEMSLVGPRPLVMDEMRFSPSWRSIRLKVKPGVTGLWQVQGRSDASFHDWIRYDVYYVKNQSLWLDLKILLKTTVVVFKKVGAY